MKKMENAPSGPPPRASHRGWLKRLAPLALILALLVAFFATGLNRYFSLDALRENYTDLRALVDANLLLAATGFGVVYALAVAISFPGAVFLTIASGVIFGTWIGGTVSVLGAGTGAVVIFLVARLALSDLVAKKAGRFVTAMRKGFQEDALAYMFFLRLVPGFPFWVVNVVPAVLGVRLPVYMLATYIGIVPGAFVYASIGNGISALVAAGEDVNLAGLVTRFEIIAPFAGLALLALLPVVLRRIFARKLPDQAVPPAGTE